MLSYILAKETLSIIAVIITIISYIPYIRDIYKGETRPHAFSWIVWSILVGIAFAGQVAGGGGVGTWSMGVTALLCASVGIISISRGEKNITRNDRLCFMGALLAIPIWLLTNDPLTAVIIVTAIDFIAFIPTFRKTYINPHSETLTLYWLATIKFTLATLALENLNLITGFFPIFTICINIIFVFMVLIRRKQNKLAFASIKG